MYDAQSAIWPSAATAIKQAGNAGTSGGTAASFPHHRYQERPRHVAPMVSEAIETAEMSRETPRCGAAHVEDVRPCEGQQDVVRIIDQTGAGVAGCLLHAAVLLASLVDGRVIPLGGPDGSAIEVFRRAQTMPAFGFLGGQGVTGAGAVAGAPVMPPVLGAGTYDEDQDRLCWSRSGNARSSCLIETTESGPRGSA